MLRRSTRFARRVFVSRLLVSASLLLIATGIAADEIVNGDFENGLDGWTVEQLGGDVVPGDVVVREGRAEIREGDSSRVTLSQTFQIPTTGTRLSFELGPNPAFDVSAQFIPDVFEVALVDTQGFPFVEPWDLISTSAFSVRETGEVLTGPQTTWDGQRIEFALDAETRGRTATIEFRFLGWDQDTEGTLTIDAVEIHRSAGVGDFVRGDSNGDDRVDLADAIATLDFLVTGEASADCLDASDANDDGKVDISDPAYTLNFLFLGGPPLPAPYPHIGFDPDPDDDLDCERAEPRT